MGAYRLVATDGVGKAVEPVSLASAMANQATGARLVTAPAVGCVQ